MSKLEAIQKDLTNDLRIFKEPFFENMEEIQVISSTGEPTWGEPLYRVRNLDFFESWYITGIVGGRRPSTYSESPWLWNTYFKKLGVKGVLFGFDLPAERDFDEFLASVLDIPEMLDLTVTDPYKSDAYRALLQVDLPVKWSAQAKHTHTVNHIIVDPARLELIILNTDGIGMKWAVEGVIGLSGKKVLIIGAGGSAASIGYEFVKAGNDLFITNRTPSKAEELRMLLSEYKRPSSKIEWGGFDMLSLFLKEADIVINTVAEGCPLNLKNMELLRNDVIITDTKYGPKADLRDMALKRGFKYIDGKAMLFGQFVEAVRFLYPLLGIRDDHNDAVIAEMKEVYL